MKELTVNMILNSPKFSCKDCVYAYFLGKYWEYCQHKNTKYRNNWVADGLSSNGTQGIISKEFRNRDGRCLLYKPRFRTIIKNFFKIKKITYKDAPDEN